MKLFWRAFWAWAFLPYGLVQREGMYTLELAELYSNIHVGPSIESHVTHNSLGLKTTALDHTIPFVETSSHHSIVLVCPTDWRQSWDLSTESHPENIIRILHHTGTQRP